MNAQKGGEPKSELRKKCALILDTLTQMTKITNKVSHLLALKVRCLKEKTTTTFKTLKNLNKSFGNCAQ